MALIDDMLLEARPALTEAPDFSIRSALRRAAGEFCRETEAWSGPLTPIRLVAGRGVYDLDLDEGQRIERVKSILLDGRPIEHVTPAALFHERNRVGSVRGCALAGDGLSVEIVATPSESEAGRVLELFCVYAPSRTASQLPDHIVDRWHDAIVARACADMQLIPNKPWTNPGAARENMALFNDAVANARRQYMTGHGAPQKLSVRRWLP